MVAACTSSVTDGVVPSQEGTLCLRIQAEDDYLSIETRESQPLADLTAYTLTLNGQTTEGETVTNQTITLDASNTAKLKAGTYTLTASNQTAATTGTGCPWHEGTSAQFTIAAGGSADVTLDLGAPKNAELKIVLAEAFTNRYEEPDLTFIDGNRVLSVTTASTLYLMPGTIPYALTADAKQGTYIQDASLTGNLTLTAGTTQTLTLSVQPITGLIRIETGDEYGGEFE
ncbi:MAG: DUF4493 domain-containing protein [Bacteroidaceae bacterium]